MHTQKFRQDYLRGLLKNQKTGCRPVLSRTIATSHMGLSSILDVGGAFEELNY